MTAIANQLAAALQLLLDNTDHAPDANCSCHLSAPCGDCTDYGGLREAIEEANAALAAHGQAAADTGIPASPAEPMFYLQDRRQYVGNCPLWWAIGGAGYTTRIDQAQRYTRAEAYDQNRTRDTDVPWPCDQIDALVRPTIDYQDLRRLPREEVQP